MWNSGRAQRANEKTATQRIGRSTLRSVASVNVDQIVASHFSEYVYLLSAKASGIERQRGFYSYLENSSRWTRAHVSACISGCYAHVHLHMI